MGVLIVLGTALVVGVVVRRIYVRPAAPSMPVAAPAGLPAPGPGPVVLPAGAHVAGIAAAGGVVAVWVSGPGGDRVLLIDPTSGAVRVLVRTAP